MKTNAVSVAIFAILIAVPSLAADDWFCSEESSRRVGTEIHACGNGVSPDEAEARLRAFDAATEEYRRLCDASSDCKGVAANASPGRTTCEQKQDGFHCKRMVVFSLVTPSNPARPGNQESVAVGTQAPTAPPKIEKGLSKREVLARFGEPTSVQDLGESNLIFHYGNSAFCEAEQGPCTVVLHDDHVDHFNAFRARNSRVLEERSFWDKLKFW